MIKHVVGIFKPGRFSVTLFEAKANSVDEVSWGVKAGGGTDRTAAAARSARMEKIEGYRRIERIVHDFDGYDLVFRQYERIGWEGGRGPRVGEPDF